MYMVFVLLVCVDALRPSPQFFFSHVVIFSKVELVLGNKDKVSCSRTQQHRAPRMYVEKTLCRYWIEVIQHLVTLATMCENDIYCIVLTHVLYYK